MGTIQVIKKFISSNWVIEKIVREFLERLPLRFRYGISYGSAFRYWLAFLRESENWDRERLEAYQIEQLRDLLIHAGNNVPYYKRIFSEYGFKPEKFQNLSDIEALPYIDRKIVKANYDAFIAQNLHISRLIPANTSGTSGIPLTVYGTKETEEKHWATVINLWSRIGYSPASRTIFFETNIRRGSRDNLPYKRYANKLILSSNYFIDEWVDRYMNMINNFRPEYIIGFPHTIAVFSSYIRKRQKPVYEGLKGIIVYAENLYTWQGDLIRSVFGKRVFSDYGMVEKVIHGGGCEHSDNYHLYPQYGFSEYLDLGNSYRELVGTGFINYAMPLIRYKTGDACSKVSKGCPDCGRAYDIVTMIEGRTGDFLVNAEGQIVSVYLNIDFRAFDNIERFQLYQEYPGTVDLRIWPKDSYKNKDADKILSEIKRSLGPQADKLSFNIALMDNKELQHSKKYRMIDQRLDIKNFLNK